MTKYRQITSPRVTGALSVALVLMLATPAAAQKDKKTKLLKKRRPPAERISKGIRFRAPEKRAWSSPKLRALGGIRPQTRRPRARPPGRDDPALYDAFRGYEPVDRSGLRRGRGVGHERGRGLGHERGRGYGHDRGRGYGHDRGRGYGHRRGRGYGHYGGHRRGHGHFGHRRHRRRGHGVTIGVGFGHGIHIGHRHRTLGHHFGGFGFHNGHWHFVIVIGGAHPVHRHYDHHVYDGHRWWDGRVGSLHGWDRTRAELARARPARYSSRVEGCIQLRVRTHRGETYRIDADPAFLDARDPGDLYASLWGELEREGSLEIQDVYGQRHVFPAGLIQEIQAAPCF